MLYIHDMAIEMDVVVEEFKRILERVGFEVIEVGKKETCHMRGRKKDGEEIILKFKPSGRGKLELCRTIVEIESEPSTHEEIQRRIRMLRGGG